MSSQIEFQIEPQYINDILQYLLSLGSSVQALPDYLQSKDSEITPEHHFRLVKWMLEFSEEMRMSNHSAMQAIALLNHFLAANRVKTKVLQLVGLVCLYVIQKQNENYQITLSALCGALNHIFSPYEIRTVELHLLRVLEWNINYTTATEITSYLLYTAIPTHNFVKVVEKADAFSVVCYERYETSLYSPLVISIVSIICTLEQLNQLPFRNSWVQHLRGLILSNVVEIDTCKALLLQHLESEGSSGAVLQRISRESIQSIIQKGR